MESLQTFLYLSSRRKLSFTTPPPPLLFTKHETDTYHTLDVNKANSDCWTRLSQKQHQDQPGLVVTLGGGGGGNMEWLTAQAYFQGTF